VLNKNNSSVFTQPTAHQNEAFNMHRQTLYSSNKPMIQYDKTENKHGNNTSRHQISSEDGGKLIYPQIEHHGTHLSEQPITANYGHSFKCLL